MPVAKNLFQQYVNNYSKFFKIITSNTHNLVHVSDEVSRFGPLPGISSYPFENHLFQIKNMVRSGRLALNQIINRTHEKELIETPIGTESLNYPLLKFPFKNEPTKFCCIVIRDGFTLRSDSFADKWFRTKNSKIVAIDYVTSANVILGKELTLTHDLFDSPLNSNHLKVQSSNATSQFKPNKQYQIDDLLCKLVAIEVKSETTFVPLIHTLPTYK